MVIYFDLPFEGNLYPIAFVRKPPASLAAWGIAGMLLELAQEEGSFVAALLRMTTKATQTVKLGSPQHVAPRAIFDISAGSGWAALST